MKLGINTCWSATTLGEYNALSVIKSAGFDGVDYNSFIYPADKGLWAGDETALYDFYRDYKRYADSIGIEILQMHAPFPTYVADESKNPAIFEAVRRSIHVCEILDCPYLVVHPPILAENRYDSLKAENRALSMDLYTRLLPDLKQTNVKIAIENMFNYDPIAKKICPTVLSHADELIDYADSLNEIAGETRFVVCLDIGHCLLTGDNVADTIRKLGSRLCLLHVHDNDGIDDRHTCPFTGIMDWPSVTEALRDIHYTGHFSLESDNFMHFSKNLFLHGLMLQSVAGRELIDMIEK